VLKFVSGQSGQSLTITHLLPVAQRCSCSHLLSLFEEASYRKSRNVVILLLIACKLGV